MEPVPARRFFLWLVWFNLIVLGLATPLYGEHYSFWNDPVSNLGRVATYPAGIPNLTARLVFDLDFLFSAIITLGIALTFFYQKNRQEQGLGLVALISAAGMIVVALNPDDISHANHVAGGVLAFGGLGILITALLGRSWRRQLIFLLPILTYAFTYFVFGYSWYSAPLQKIALVSIAYSLFWIGGSQKS